MTTGMGLALIIGSIFSPIAALMAFIITHEEYKHHYPDRKTPLNMAVSMGIFTFLFFLILSAGIGFVLNMMFGS